MHPRVWPTVIIGSLLLARGGAQAADVTFHKDVAPVLQKQCQSCHRPGDIAPMPLITYQDARPYAKAIRAAVLQKTMPPWFAEPGIGHFANDRTLTPAEIDVFVRWADTGAREGDRKDAPKPLQFAAGWRIGKPDVIFELPVPFNVPATGTVPYQYIRVPTGFTEDKWVEAVEVQAGDRSVVHHINAYTSLPSQAAKGQRTGEFFTFTADEAGPRGGDPPQFSNATTWEMLEVHVPGGVTPVLKPGQARLIKAGSEIEFQLHYTPNGKATQDRSRIGLIFAKQPPKERVKGVLIFNQRFTIPPGVPNHRVEARAEVKHDVKLVNMLPHMHLRGKSMEFRATYPSGESEVLLRVPRYDFNWQLTYYLQAPKLLPAGTVLDVVGHYDNSAGNRHNPDPTAEVIQGDQTWEEMLNGFLDVAVEAKADLPAVFGPAPSPAPTAPSAPFASAAPPTYHRDVLPILQRRCQECHRPGEIGPMALTTYEQTRPYARAIRNAVKGRTMPPWFADRGVGRYSNDRSLTDREIETLAAWADNGAPPGDPAHAPAAATFKDGWRIGTPDVVFEMPKEFHVPASGTIEYQTIMIPTGFTEDKWVQAVEFRPGTPSVVHHAVVYSREPGSSYARSYPLGEFFELDADLARSGVRWKPQPGRTMFAEPDYPLHLQVFVPGGDPPVLPAGQARLIKAGSDIVFQLHYSATGKPAVDRSRIGLIFAKAPPHERVKTVRIHEGVAIRIPPGEPDHRMESRVELQQELKIVSLQPHMHFRGRFFEYSVIYPNGKTEVLLRVPRYDFLWQQTYYLETAKTLPKGSVLITRATFDNSAANRHNPDPTATVRGGPQSWQEMMAGFMEVAFDPSLTSLDFFRDAPVPTPAPSPGR